MTKSDHEIIGSRFRRVIRIENHRQYTYRCGSHKGLAWQAAWLAIEVIPRLLCVPSSRMIGRRHYGDARDFWCVMGHITSVSLLALT